MMAAEFIRVQIRNLVMNKDSKYLRAYYANGQSYIKAFDLLARALEKLIPEKIQIAVSMTSFGYTIEAINTSGNKVVLVCGIMDTFAMENAPYLNMAVDVTDWAFPSNG